MLEEKKKLRERTKENLRQFMPPPYCIQSLNASVMSLFDIKLITLSSFLSTLKKTSKNLSTQNYVHQKMSYPIKGP